MRTYITSGHQLSSADHPTARHAAGERLFHVRPHVVDDDHGGHHEHGADGRSEQFCCRPPTRRATAPRPRAQSSGPTKLWTHRTNPQREQTSSDRSVDNARSVGRVLAVDVRHVVRRAVVRGAVDSTAGEDSHEKETIVRRDEQEHEYCSR